MTESEPQRPRLSAVLLIYVREMRDQLRDRRTIFTIAVLPLVLYPLVGTLLLQIAQFTQQHTPAVCVIGTDHLPADPPLIDGNQFAHGLLPENSTIRLTTYRWDELAATGPVRGQAATFIARGTFDAVLIVPPDFSLLTAPPGSAAAVEPAASSASLDMVFNPTSDAGRVGSDRLYQTLEAWRERIVASHLTANGLDRRILTPFAVHQVTSKTVSSEALLWSKLLPFVMLVWAMTGAFYPAIDLVAGEKERGTLETLLCSPALRSEIVWGKLAAVTTFSTLTALLNVSSMLVTSIFVFRQVGMGLTGGASMGPPPLISLLWLLLALLPLSALFSSLALAVAALARSSKEGQYYLMPLMMVVLPLVLLPLMPGTTLNTGTSLIPVTGMFLLVRALVENQYAAALMHLPMVVGVTFGCLWLAARWAQRQFEDESVLFRSGDQWELKMWMRHLWRDRQVVPTPTQSFACGAVILVGLFFGKLMVAEMPDSFAGIARLVLLPQLGLILAPVLLMATVLTMSLRQSLRLRMPALGSLAAALLLGITLHPSYVTLGRWISETYPISEQAQAAMQPFVDVISGAPLVAVILLLAVVPAICEELAFRGFIFAGLVRQGGRLRAIVVTAAMFGISHGVLQQSIAATVMGVLLGWIALRTGSVLPGLLLHMTNNALSVSLERIPGAEIAGSEFFVRSTEAGPAYQPVWIVMASGLAVTCLLYFSLIQPAGDEAETELSAADLYRLDPGLKPAAP